MNDFPSITCPQCGMVSYNTNDIEHKYCGNCHEWHEHMLAKKALGEMLRELRDQKTYCDYSCCLVRYIEHYHIDQHTLTFLKPEDRKDHSQCDISSASNS